MSPLIKMASSGLKLALMVELKQKQERLGFLPEKRNSPVRLYNVKSLKIKNVKVQKLDYTLKKGQSPNKNSTV